MLATIKIAPYVYILNYVILIHIDLLFIYFNHLFIVFQIELIFKNATK